MFLNFSENFGAGGSWNQEDGGGGVLIGLEWLEVCVCD